MLHMTRSVNGYFLPAFSSLPISPALTTMSPRTAYSAFMTCGLIVSPVSLELATPLAFDIGGSPGFAVDTLSLGRVLTRFQAIRACPEETSALFFTPAITALIIITVAYPALPWYRPVRSLTTLNRLI